MRRWAWITLQVTAALLGAGAEVVGQGAGALLERVARLDVADVPVADALVALQQSSGVTLAYSPDLLPKSRRVECRCLERTVRQALDRILEGTGLRYVEQGRRVLIGPPDGGDGGAPEADVLTGTVVDASHGRLVPSADVQLLPSGARTVSDERGRFSFRGVAAGVHRVVVTALGYREATVEVRVPAAEGPLRILLESAPVPLQEIVIAPGQIGILDVRAAVMGNTLSRADIEAIPEFGDDAFRTLHGVPGVATDGISTRLNIRGAADRDVLMRLDGVELFEPYHLRELDGALGIVDVQALSGIDLITGGFPAEYGDRMAAVFDMTTRRPPAEGTRNTVGMSLSSLSYSSQGSFAEGKGEWLGSLRRGFLDIVLDIAGTDDSISPRYWDALARVQYALTPNHLISFNVLHAGDDVRWSDEEDTGSLVESTWANGYAWLGWQAALGSRVRARTIASTGTLSRDRDGGTTNPTAGVFTPLAARMKDQSDFTYLGLRQEWQVEVSPDLLVKAGFEGRRSSGSYAFRSAATYLDLDQRGYVTRRTDSLRVNQEPSDTWSGAWLSGRARTGSAFTWEAGLRYDRHSLTGEGHVAPRLLGRLDAGPRTVVRASWGHYYQAQAVHELNVADGDTTFSRAQRAEQVAVGVERRLGAGVSARAEAYLRNVRDPHPYYANLTREINPLLELDADRMLLRPTRGRARGVELTLDKASDSPFFWTASYVLAQAEDEIAGRWVPRTLDQRHTVNLLASWRSGDRWQLSALWQYHSGWPATGQKFDLVASEGPGGEQFTIVQREFGPLNAESLPAYHRLDVRATRAFMMRKARVELFLDVFNVLNRTNLRGYEYNLIGDPQGHLLSAQRRDGEELLPILPTVGFRVSF